MPAWPTRRKVDVAILAVPADKLDAAIAECAACGVGCCVIITTGFAEADEAGAAQQQRLVDIARPAGMRIIGPNCMGLINPGPPPGPVLLDRARRRGAAGRPDRPDQPERRTDGVAARSRLCRRDRLQQLRLARQSGRSRDLRRARVYGRRSRYRCDLRLCRGFRDAARFVRAAAAAAPPASRWWS